MKIGDKVQVLETGRIGWIIAETPTAWKIDFIDGNKPELVDKTTPLRLVVDVPNPNPSPNPGPKDKWGWKRWLWTVGIILFIAFAIYLTLKNVI